MKKIVLFICLIIAAAAAGTITFLMTSAPSSIEKFSKDDIAFTTITDKNGEFVSNFTESSGEKKYEVYEIKISNTKNVAFENPVVEHSGNVFVNSQTITDGINISFQVDGGTSFSFTISSDNFETTTMMYAAREYIQRESLNLKVSTSPTGPFQDYVLGNNNNLYIIDNQHKSAALADGYPSELWVIPYSTTHPGAVFTTTVSASGHLNLDGNSAPYRLTAKSEGSSYLEIYTQDGSNIGRAAIFACKYVSPTGISGLPNKIDIDMSATTQYILPNFTVLPVYAQNYEITFESSNKNVFTFESGKITAVSTGSAELWIKVDGEVFAEIPVNITFTQAPEFAFALDDITLECFENAISLTNNTLTVDISNIASSYFSITILVGIENFGGVVENITTQISDPSGILFTPAGEPAFGTGTENYVPYIINLSKTTGSLSIEFSKTIDNQTISKTIIINLINN